MCTRLRSPPRAHRCLQEDMRSACASSDALTLHGWSTPLRPELAEVFTALYKEYKSRASRIPVMAEVLAYVPPRPRRLMFTGFTFG